MPRVAEHHYPSGLRQLPHSHDTTSVTLVIAGSIRERVGSHDVIGKPFDLVIKPAGVVHANDFGSSGSRTLQLVLSSVEAQHVARVNAALEKWQWTHAAAALPAMLALLSSLRKRGHETDDLVWNALGLINAESGATGDAPRWLQEVRERLDDEPLRQPVTQLARGAEVHPVYLTRQFRRWFGTSVIEYAARRRLQRAASLLHGDRTLSQVAHEAGFADQAHFCRAFRRHTGMTASAFRTLVHH